jgi:two-component system, NtrC family, sensor kinase
MQCPRCHRESPPGHSFCGLCGTPLQGLEGTAESAPSYRELQRSLTRALDQQTASAEILGVISKSHADVQPVLNVIAQRAMTLCEAQQGAVLTFDGELIHIAAVAHMIQGWAEIVHRAFPRPPGPGSASARAILTRTVIHIPDVLIEPEYELREGAIRVGIRAVLSVPMVHEDQVVGTITLDRTEPIPFSDNQITLLQTFAAQAVIAIENVRLFTELQASNRELTTALDTQTATSEILRVISQSQTDVQPVFDAILSSAIRLMGAQAGVLTRITGDCLELAAFKSTDDRGEATIKAAFPLSLQSDGVHAKAIRDRSPVNIADAQSDARLRGRSIAHAVGYQSLVAVPMILQDVAVGTISATRRESGGFTDDEIALLQTFADQAVIAIENVRLFNETKEALERQTATADILRVIGRSPTDVQPVFEAIARSGVSVCVALGCAVFAVEGDTIRVAATHGVRPERLERFRQEYPAPLDAKIDTAQTIRDRRVFHLADIEHNPNATASDIENARLAGYRTRLMVPMVRGNTALGLIAVTREAPTPFPDQQVALLKTFADQAVIAIENVRLFTELQARTHELTRSVGQLTALGEVGRAVSSTLDLETVLTTIVSRAVQLSGLDGGVVFEYDEAAEEFVQRVATETGGALAEIRRNTRFRKGEGVLGRTAITLEPAQVPDITVPGAYESRLRENLIESGIRAILAAPMVRENRVIGCLAVTRNHPGEFAAETIELLRTFATQSALAIQNARLFREIEEKSCQVEAASQHKSEFLANMSHELRTPLNAIIGFSEVLTDRMFGELNEKQEEYLKDIYASGNHLLSLINDILDLSKIEAGRMELELTDFHLPTGLDNALTLVRERAGRRSITLQTSVDERLGEIRADERKIRQVVLNLLSNAIKFTPEGGRIEVAAAPRDGSVEVAISDTGVGIAPEDQEAVFEEFRQVGTADKKAEGTGLGLTLCRKFIELHGGRIWVKSQVGQGSTFTFTIPVRPGE